MLPDGSRPFRGTFNQALLQEGSERAGGCRHRLPHRLSRREVIHSTLRGREAQDTVEGPAGAFHLPTAPLLIALPLDSSHEQGRPDPAGPTPALCYRRVVIAAALPLGLVASVIRSNASSSRSQTRARSRSPLAAAASPLRCASSAARQLQIVLFLIFGELRFFCCPLAYTGGQAIALTGPVRYRGCCPIRPMPTVTEVADCPNGCPRLPTLANL